MITSCVIGVCVLLFGPLVSDACNVTLYAQREPRNFTSPNYPRNYPSNDNCYWDIYPQTRGYRVVLDMVFSDIESSPGATCRFDALTIYTGNNDDQNLADSHRICGQSRWNIITREDQHFHAVFETDGSVTGGGFLIRYYETDGGSNCGVPLVATRAGKTFTSPGYPNTYFLRQSCTWTITTEQQNQAIFMYPTDSVLERASPRGMCDSDYVTVYNGQNSSDKLGTFCGNERPVFSSGGNSLRVHLQTDSSNNYKGFKMFYRAIPATTCFGTMPAGQNPIQIVSPGFPNNYQSGLDCQWTINATPGRTIKVEVLFADMENVPSCAKDYLLFKDGTTNSARQLAKICERTSTAIVSSSNHMTIIFHSDINTTGRGFRLQYSSEGTHVRNCGSSLLSASTSTWRYLSSPGYPNYNYNNNMDCKWTISAPVGYIVKVEIKVLSVEYEATCTRDYLLFNDGTSSYGTQLGRYCIGTRDVVSSDNAMTITFHTDSSVTDRGFSLKYMARRSGCGTEEEINEYETKYIESPNYPLAYPDNADCSWTISTDVEGYVIHVEVEYFYLEQDSTCSFDYVQLYDGNDLRPVRVFPEPDERDSGFFTRMGTYEHSLGRWCGFDGPDTQSTGLSMKVRFVSDSSNTFTGFKLAFTAGEPTSSPASFTPNFGGIIGGIFGGIVGVAIVTCVCCGMCSRQNRSREANGNNVYSIPLSNYPSTTSTTQPAMFTPPPAYSEVVKDDPPPYCLAVPLSDTHPVVTSSLSGEHQGIDNPAGPS